MAKLEENSIAPDFSLKDAQGKTHKLSDYKGKKVILYFYPKDDTPGCTVEACNFRDNYESYKKKGVIILGVSADDETSHKKFAEKYSLPFTLLSDPEHKVLLMYDVWKKKSMYGRIFWGIQRTTYLIDENRKIIKVFPKVDPKIHSKEILELV